jgi:hypothetical protein
VEHRPNVGRCLLHSIDDGIGSVVAARHDNLQFAI